MDARVGKTQERWSGMLTYHFVFAIVSSAMLGLGLGGLMFRLWGRRAPGRADLIGAAGGALAVVPGMDAIGPVNPIFLSALVAALSACLLGLPRLAQALPAIGSAVLIGGLLAAFTLSGVNPTVAPRGRPLLYLNLTVRSSLLYNAHSYSLGRRRHTHVVSCVSARR